MWPILILIFQRLCHKTVYIRQFGGTREFKTPNHSSLQCACCHFVICFFFFHLLCLPEESGLKVHLCASWGRAEVSVHPSTYHQVFQETVPLGDSVAGQTSSRDALLVLQLLSCTFLTQRRKGRGMSNSTASQLSMLRPGQIVLCCWSEGARLCRLEIPQSDMGKECL
jgi:hypothetical protein